MMKKAFALMLMLLSVPVFASAYNCWSVTKAASPSTAYLINAIDGPDATAPGVYPGISLSANATTPGVVTYATTLDAAACVANDVVQSMDFDVSADNYAVTQVRLDGVVLDKVNGKYTVPRLVGKSNRNLLVYYAPLASAYTITTQPAGGGSVTPSFKTAASSTPKVSVTPFPGYMLTGLTITPAVSYNLEQVKNQGYFEFPAVTQNYTFKASFAATPKASALLSTNLFALTPGQAALLDGTKSYSSEPSTTYDWSVSPSASTTLTPNGKTATFAASVVGDYVVTLTLGNTGLTPAPRASLTIKVQAAQAGANSACIGCHQNGDPQVITDYLATGHATNSHGPSCADCHANGSASHPYFNKTGAIASCINCHKSTPYGDYRAHGGAYDATVPLACVGCHDPHSLAATGVHEPIPTPINTNLDAAKAAVNNCESCHQSATSEIYSAWSTGHHGAATGHTTGTCQRCHASEGALAGAIAGWTGSYSQLSSTSAAVWTPNAPASSNDGISCAACHDPLSSNGLRSVNTYTGGVVVPWNPTLNGSSNAQYATCTSCHTLTDNTGALVGNYHDGGSINTNRTIADTHYDNPATVSEGASAKVEGYVIRANLANPCADCHNVHAADLEIQEAWAASAHAGKISVKKYEAQCNESVNWFNTTYPTNPAVPVAEGACETTATVGTSTRTVLEFFNRNAAGIAFSRTTGVIDDADGNAWVHYNWDASSRSACQRCHTATGASNFLNNPADYVAANNNFSHLSNWTAATGSPQNELMYCWGCHSDSQTGALRNPGAITEVYAAATAGAPTATVNYPNINQSNVCMGCHVGREIGQNVTNDTDADGTRSFINSHYMTAGSTIFNVSGYEYAGQTYPQGFHQYVGVADNLGTGTAGPCVTCHMTGAEAHSFEVLKADGNPATTQCAKCHTGLDAAALTAAADSFHHALEDLEAALAAKGIHYYGAHPYFYTAPYVVGGTNTAYTTWAVPYGLDKWKDVMGAAFNFNVFHHDPGAYAHNRPYALKLIADSIDFLADGIVNGVGVPAEVTAEMMVPGSFDGHIATSVNCTDCHNSNLQPPPVVASPVAAHALTGQVVYTVDSVSTTATTVVINANIKLDGQNDNEFVTVVAAASYTAGTTVVNGTTNTYSSLSGTTAASAVAVSNLGNGNYSFTVTPPVGTQMYDLWAPDKDTTWMIRVKKAAGIYPEANIVAHQTASGNHVRNIVSNTACINCHGDNIFPLSRTPLSREYHNTAYGVGSCVTCHTHTARNNLVDYAHKIHNSHNMPSGEVQLKAPSAYGSNLYSVTYPTYMQNCSVCHDSAAALAAVNAKPVSYDFCMGCHENWSGFGDGTGIFGFNGDSLDHNGYTATTNCNVCHSGDTVSTYHNNLQTGRAGVIFNGVDTSVVEGAKVDVQITGVSRSGANLLVNWTASYNGSPVNPCNAVAGTTAPAFFAAAANATTGQVAGGFSILRAYAQGDDFINPGIGTAPGQPVSTNLITGAGSGNTTCASNVATSTIALSTAEQGMTRGRVAIQGKAQLDLSASFPGIDTNTATGIQPVDQVRSKSPTREFMVADGSLPVDTRRAIVDTASCLKCHPGSLYQHGGNRVDNNDLCVMCHNEASSEQNVRVFDGVDASEAYDGKPGMTYGFKSLLHAVHSAGDNGAITMSYRTNGNYVWAGHDTVIPNYPTNDVYSDGNNGRPNNVGTPPVATNPIDDDPLKTAPVGSGIAALIYGSSAPHGTGPETVAPYVQFQVYRAHNLHHTTYPQVLNSCVACHVPGSFGFPDPAKSMATTVDVGGVLATQATSTGAVYGDQTDDKVMGTSAAACYSCHQGSMAPADFHGTAGGFAPGSVTGRSSVPAETCVSCHN